MPSNDNLPYYTLIYARCQYVGRILLGSYRHVGIRI